MAKQPKDHQVMRHSGEDGKARAGTKFLTGWGAQGCPRPREVRDPSGLVGLGDG